VIASAYTPGVGMAYFPPGSLPPQLGDADVRAAWEGQSNKDAPEYLILDRVNGYDLEVRVYFGTQHPSDARASRAQAELARLQVPVNDTP